MSGSEYMRKTSFCPVMIRCDGEALRKNRAICGPCERAMKQKAKKHTLRGERYAASRDRDDE